MTHFQNPILRGFNPDPSIVRVGDDYVDPLGLLAGAGPIVLLPLDRPD